MVPTGVTLACLRSFQQAVQQSASACLPHDVSRAHRVDTKKALDCWFSPPAPSLSGRFSGHSCTRRLHHPRRCLRSWLGATETGGRREGRGGRGGELEQGKKVAEEVAEGEEDGERTGITGRVEGSIPWGCVPEDDCARSDRGCRRRAW